MNAYLESKISSCYEMMLCYNWILSAFCALYLKILALNLLHPDLFKGSLLNSAQAL